MQKCHVGKELLTSGGRSVLSQIVSQLLSITPNKSTLSCHCFGSVPRLKQCQLDTLQLTFRQEHLTCPHIDRVHLIDNRAQVLLPFLFQLPPRVRPYRRR